MIRKTENDPADLRLSIQQFHAKPLSERKRGNYKLCDLDNMEQAPLPFPMDDSKTYDSNSAD